MKAPSRYEAVAAAAAKRFQKMVLAYRGPPEGLKPYLLRELDRLESKGDEIPTDLMEGYPNEPPRARPGFHTYVERQAGVCAEKNACKCSRFPRPAFHENSDAR